MKKDTGGSAFPRDVYNGDTDEPYNQTEGATLRDYFAAKALNGLVVGRSYTEIKGHLRVTADVAYLMADAMLEARK